MRPAAKIFYFEDDKTKLVAGLEPLVRSLRSNDGASVYILPHWKHGPHLNLVAGFGQEEFDQDIYPYCQRFIADLLNVIPSAMSLDEEPYAALSERLGQAELESGPYLPLQSDNRVIRSNFELSCVADLPSLLEIKESFLTCSLDFVFALARRKVRGANYTVVLAAALVCVGQFWGRGGLREAQRSFWMHAEVLLSRNPELRTHFEGFSERIQPEIDAVVRLVTDEFQRETYFRNTDPLLADWVAMLDRHHRRILDCVDANMSTFQSWASREAGTEAVSGRTDIAAEPSARWLRDALSRDDIRQLFGTRDHIAYRLLINMFYQLLPLLSLAPLQRHLLCFLVSTGCRNVLGPSKTATPVFQEGLPS
jgi:hypothetical protein